MRRPFLRPLLVWALACPLLALAVALCFLLAPFLGGSRAFWTVAPGYIRLVARLFGIRRRLEGWEELPAEIREGRRPVVFVGNHASLFDPPLMISTLPSHPVFIAKRELALVPFLGWVIWLADFIFIDRGRLERAKASLASAVRRVHEGQSVVVFPEGTRSRSGELLPFKKGSFLLAKEAGAEVVPVAIHGGSVILPPGSWRVAPGDYRMTLGAPLHADGFEDPEGLRAATEARLREMLSRG
ncbi:MAG TPA: lysophospholipid acyltransferase family protein [Holophagaceae bacterium]|nr:lysophospholipid acyltransferase family protein [Holophagaceae bacterium]